MGIPAAQRICCALAFAVLVPACGAVPASAPSPAPSATTGCSPSPSPSPSASPFAELSISPSPSTVPTVAKQRSIQISLSAQHLWARDGETVVVSVDVTTGRPELPTPTGRFKILAKYSPYRFISPWPRGSPYYYEPVTVGYAMLFAAGGYFIHDAAWQQNFGPGGNLRTGSHGCVNVPPAAMPALYRWARVGEAVVITR